MLIIPPPIAYLRLQAFKNYIRFSQNQLGDIHLLNEQIIRFFTVQLKASCESEYTSWEGEMLVEQHYLVATPEGKPYEKRVTLSLLFYEWLTIEMKLDVHFSDELHMGFGVDFHQIQQELTPSRFAAVLQSSLPEERPLNLIASARYIRGIDTTDPIVTYGVVQINFHFPAGCFETTSDKDIQKIVQPI
ncbi:hypothetical protein [Spirosoma arcticum]